MITKMISRLKNHPNLPSKIPECLDAMLKNFHTQMQLYSSVDLSNGDIQKKALMVIKFFLARLNHLAKNHADLLTSPHSLSVIIRLLSLSL